MYIYIYIYIYTYICGSLGSTYLRDLVQSDAQFLRVRKQNIIYVTRLLYITVYIILKSHKSEANDQKYIET